MYVYLRGRLHEIYVNDENEYSFLTNFVFVKEDAFNRLPKYSFISCGKRCDVEMMMMMMMMMTMMNTNMCVCVCVIFIHQ